MVGFLIMLVMGANTYFILQQKTNEITSDIGRNAIAFSTLASSDIVSNYLQAKKSGNFIVLPGKVKSLLELHPDMKNVRILTGDGEVLYDFLLDKEGKYTGEKRNYEHLDEISRLSSGIPSIKLSSTNKTIFFEQKISGEISYQSKDGTEEKNFVLTDKIENILFPVTQDKTYLVAFSVGYDTLLLRVNDTSKSMLEVMGVSVLIGLFVAFMFSSRIVKPIRKLSETALAISKGDFGKIITTKSKDEVGRLANSFNKMSVELKSATDQLVAKERLNKEIELASKIQSEFLPKSLPTVGQMDIQAGVNSADAVGGDLYDFIALDDDTMIFYVGDVTGHGVSAGLVTAIANSIVYSLSFSKDGYDVRKISLGLNRVLRAKTRTDMFITAFVGLYNAKKHMFYYCACGHEPTYVFKQKTGELIQLKKEGIALGMVDDIDPIIKEENISLEKGDVVIMYTDGIPEAWNNSKELFGFKRFEESIKKHGNLKTSKEIYDALLADVYKFMDGHPQADDITLVVMKKP